MLTIRYEWRRLSAMWFAETATTELRAGGEVAGRLKQIGLSGAVAETPAGAFSFRVGGLDPARPSWWRRYSHNLTVFDLATQSDVAEFSVGPLHRSLRFPHGREFEWRLSFLARNATWKERAADVCSIQRRTIWSSQGLVLVEDSLNERDGNILAFLGLYLLV